MLNVIRKALLPRAAFGLVALTGCLEMAEPAANAPSQVDVYSAALTQSECVRMLAKDIPTWPALPAISFGVIAPGKQPAFTQTDFFAPTGSLSAGTSDGFAVAGLESFTRHCERVPVDVDPGELPPGHKPLPKFEYEIVETLHRKVAGSEVLTVESGDLIKAYLAATSSSTADGTLWLTTTSGTSSVPLHLTVGEIKITLDVASMTLPQGRSATIGVTAQSLGGDGHDVSLDFWRAVEGVTFTDTSFFVPSGQTVHHVVQVTTSRAAPIGLHQYAVAADTFKRIGVGAFDLTISALPVQTVSVPLGDVRDAWNNARDQACEVIKGQMGEAVVQAIGRTIRSPECSLSPLNLAITRSGNSLNLVGVANGNRIGAHITTPDGLPSDLDPCFFMFFDLRATASVALPTTLNGAGVRVNNLQLDVNSPQGPQSCSTTGDIVQWVASVLGYGSAFQPIRIGMGGPDSELVERANAALSQLDAALQAAAASGFSVLDFTFDPQTLVLTLRLS